MGGHAARPCAGEAAVTDHKSVLQTGTTDPARSHSVGVTSDEAENPPRLRVGYGEDSLESEPPLKRRVKTHTAKSQDSSTPVPWRWRSRGARIRGWDRRRRVLAKAEYNAQGDNPRFVVTNLPGEPQSLYDDVYCARGEMENRIKEQQLMLFADRTSCHRFLANQFRLLLSAAAYVLVEAVRRLGLSGTELARAQVSTIRLRLLKVAGLVQVSVRRVYVRLASGFPLQGLFAVVLERLGGVVGAETASG
jgi:Transposase DDE domain group 1